MGTLQFKNNASTTLSGSINNSQTAITVISGASFPVPAAGDYFYATMYEVSGHDEINIEIVKVTAVSGNNWTIVRAQDGTTARARDGIATCYIEQRMTAASAQQMLQKDNNLSDLPNPATARTNLGLGSMATQDASAVAITGGTIGGVTITGVDSTTTISDNADSTKKVAFEVSGVTTGTTRTLTIPNASGTIALLADLTVGYQPLDSDLTALAALAANGLIARTGAGTVSVRSITAPAAGLTVSNGDGVSGNPTMALANDLAAVESIATTGFVRRTGVDTWSASAIVDGDLPSALTGKTYNALTLAANATGFAVSGGTTSKTLTIINSVTLAGTDGTTITLPATTGTVALNNQTMFIGTTSVAINRASGSLSLTGVNIDGSAGSAATAATATRATNLAGGNNTTLLGAIGYQSNTDTTTLLSPNVTTTKQFLSQTGTGTNGAAPVWSAVAKADVGLGNVENTALSTWAGSANITTLGTVASGTWNATTISIAKGGTGATTQTAGFNALAPTTTLGDLIYSDGTNNVRLAGNTTATRRFLRQTGTGSASAAPAWDTLTDPDIPSALTGKTYNGLTLVAAGTGFTVAGGATSKTLAVNNTLTFSGTDGSTLNIGAGGTLGSAAYTASTAYAPAAGSASVTTLGTITSGTWAGSTIGISYGGTGATSKIAAFDALSPAITLGDLIYSDGTDNVRLAGNTTTAKRFLTQTGTGTVSAAPGWNAIVDGDLPSALTGKTYNGLTLTANATGFQVAGGATAKTLAVSNNLTLAGTDGSTLNIGAGGTLGSAAFTASTAYPSTTGSGASGTWGINITGSAGSVAWTSVSGRPTAVSAFTNDAGYITSSASISGNAATATKLQTARTINGASFDGSANIQAPSDWSHSSRDFPNGTLVETSIDYSQSSGDPWILEIRGNSYGSLVPFEIQYQGYIYSDTVIGHGGYSVGTSLSGLVLFNYNGKLCFWWPNQTYWHGYNIRAYSANAGFPANLVTSITNAAKPGGVTKEVALSSNIRQALRSDNFQSYAPTLTGSGASGTWGINITGSAGSVAWTNVSGRPTAVSSFTNDSGYITSSALSSYLPLAGGTLTGNLAFSGTGRVIQGDLSNATPSLRTAFQSSTANGNTIVTAKPNGTATGSYFITHNASDVDNSSHMYVGVTSTQAQLRSDKTGTGSFVPLGIYVGGAERAVVDTSGNITPSVDNAQTLGSASKRWSDVQTASISAGSYNGGQLAGMRNRIINGDMRVAQRGDVAVVANTVQYGGCDRFTSAVTAATASGTIRRQSGISGTVSGYAQAITSLTTTGTTTVAWSQRIEKENTYSLNGKSVTVQLKVWQDTGSTQTFTAGIYKANAADNFSSTTLIGSTSSVSVPTSTWTTMTFTVTLGATDASNGLLLYGAYNSIAAVTSKFFNIGDVQLEQGSVATPFEHRPYGVELALCQRYFQTFSFSENLIGFQLTGYSTSAAVGHLKFPVTMRAAPIAGATGPITANLPGLGGITFASGIAATTNTEGSQITATGGSSLSVGQPAALNGGAIQFNAEL
jgi:hypothetical protein